jgi:hypothetical protein
MRWLDWKRAAERPCRLFLLGGALLSAQYLASTRGREPYPVLRLPSGSAVVRDGQAFTNRRFVVYALTPDGSRLPVDERLMLEEFEVTYHDAMLARGFGLLPGSTTSEHDAVEARRWIRTRLQRQLEHQEIHAIEIVAESYRPSVAGKPAPGRVVGTARVGLE